MSKSKHALAQAVLARISLGAVPMDGIYWFDPKALQSRDSGNKSAAEDADQKAAGPTGEGCEHRSA
ncbi:MAG: hypothetical protein JSR66_22240 [Proteobacteria bacterium]|nr:hypothetical protein [Pseudomonadota bacterium]